MESTRADIDAMARRAAAGLCDRGVRERDAVCLKAPNSPELLAVIDGALRSGVAPVLISASATERETGEMSSDVDARMVLDDDDVQALVQTVEQFDLAPIPACRPVHFTSGTSGRPKAVWSNWLAPELIRGWIDDEQDAWGITETDVHLVCGPLSHSAPLRFALMTLWAGGSVAVPGKFDAGVVASSLSFVNTTFMAPTHLQRIMEAVGEREVVHSLRLLAHAGAACPERVRTWAHETFGSDAVMEFYGSTEGQFTRCSPDDWRSHPGSVGRARPGRQLRVDEEGKLWSKAPPFARFEYWGDSEKTAQTWDGDWFTVGDYGRIDADGYVYLEGRKGDLIITGAVNVYPAEIERVLTELPGVENVVAFGLPDEHWGQRVCVAVTGAVTEDEVLSFARAQLSGPRRPKSVYVVDELPVTHSGKIDRRRVPSLFPL